MATPMFSGPDPAEPGMYLCTICAMMFKHDALETESAQLVVRRAAQAGDDSARIWHDLSLGMSWEPAMAVAIATTQLMPQWGPIPTCWSHMQGLEVRQGGGLAVAQGALPPELPMGNGGVPILGRRPGRPQ
jgi:hypothetical protein